MTAYRVLLFVLWFEVQNGLVAVRDSPQGFTSSGSVMLARPGTLETRFVCAYCALAGSGQADGRHCDRRKHGETGPQDH